LIAKSHSIMRRVFVLMTIFFSTILINSVSCEIFLSANDVSYVISNSAVYSGVLVNFNVTTALRFQATYNLTTEGMLPSNTVCHLEASQKDGTLNTTYHIEVLGSPTDGSWSMPLPQVLGDSPAYPIPVGSVGTMTITVHGYLKANVTLDTGSANPSQLTWTSWGTQNTTVTASVNNVILTLETAYNVYFTVTFSASGIPLISQNSTETQDVGTPNPQFPIAEFSTYHFLPLLMVTTLLIVAVSLRQKKRYCHSKSRQLP